MTDRVHYMQNMGLDFTKVIRAVEGWSGKTLQHRGQTWLKAPFDTA